MPPCQLIYGILVIFQASHHSFFVSLLGTCLVLKRLTSLIELNEQKLYRADANL